MNPSRPDDYLVRHSQWRKFVQTLPPGAKWIGGVEIGDYNPWESDASVPRSSRLLAVSGCPQQPLPWDASLVVFRCDDGLFFLAFGGKHPSCHPWGYIAAQARMYETIPLHKTPRPPKLPQMDF